MQFQLVRVTESRYRLRLINYRNIRAQSQIEWRG